MKQCWAWIVSLAIIGCGGSDFVGAQAQGDGAVDVIQETNDASLHDVGVDEDTGASTDAKQTEADALQLDAVDETEEDASADHADAPADAEDEPEASIEAGDEKLPDVCVPTSCQAEGKNCGLIPDGCGGIIASCGSCPTSQSCGGGGVPNVCGGCTPSTCQTLGKNCGSIPDGCGGTISSCGSCSGTESCGGGGVPNVCGVCVPTTCYAQGYNCGSIPDGCGKTLVCGPAYTLWQANSTTCVDEPPNMWICGDFPTGSLIGPPPFPGCMKAYHGTLNYAYCCQES